MIRIADINSFSEKDYQIMYNLMSAERQDRADRYLRSADRKLCILSDYISRQLISEECGIPVSEINILTEKHGKPYVDIKGIHFNYSHSYPFVFCAVSASPVGVDIETVKDVDFRAARRFATEKETCFINNSNENFLKIWTLKEAYLKCSGEGINGNLKSVEFEVDGNTVNSDKQGYEFKLISNEEYIAAVCTKKEVSD